MHTINIDAMFRCVVFFHVLLIALLRDLDPYLSADDDCLLEAHRCGWVLEHRDTRDIHNSV